MEIKIATLAECKYWCTESPTKESKTHLFVSTDLEFTGTLQIWLLHPGKYYIHRVFALTDHFERFAQHAKV